VARLERGVVDEDVEPAELLDRAVDERPAVALVADVARQAQRRSIGALDPAGRLFGGRLLLR
jgi:hypothetical protein